MSAHYAGSDSKPLGMQRRRGNAEGEKQIPKRGGESKEQRARHHSAMERGEPRDGRDDLWDAGQPEDHGACVLVRANSSGKWIERSRMPVSSVSV